MVKDLNEEIFKHYIYIKYYNIALDLVWNLRFEKVSNIIFNKELVMNFKRIFDIER